MGEVVITRAKCGTRQAFHGSKWEIALEAEVWLKQLQQAKHQAKQVPARTPKSRQADSSAARAVLHAPERRVARALHGITTGA